MQGTCCAPAHTTDCCTTSDQQNDTTQRATQQHATRGIENCVCVPASALPTTIVACCCCGTDASAEKQTDTC